MCLIYTFRQTEGDRAMNGPAKHFLLVISIHRNLLRLRPQCKREQFYLFSTMPFAWLQMSSTAAICPPQRNKQDIPIGVNSGLWVGSPCSCQGRGTPAFVWGGCFPTASQLASGRNLTPACWYHLEVMSLHHPHCAMTL